MLQQIVSFAREREVSAFFRKKRKVRELTNWCEEIRSWRRWQRRWLDFLDKVMARV
jgi:hypothetical protein